MGYVICINYRPSGRHVGYFSSATNWTCHVDKFPALTKCVLGDTVLKGDFTTNLEEVVNLTEEP